MRSPSRTIRIALLPLLVGAGLSLSGCQVGRTFFRMDSNAPIPFFGMDLLPQRDKKSPTDGVSRFQNEAVSVTGESTPRQGGPSSMRDLSSQTATALPTRSQPTHSQPAASRG